MNERTQELIKQFATDLFTRSGYDMREYEPFLEEAEKFVELIVRECIDLISVNHDPNSDWDWEVSRGHAIAIIKEHFGVEEPQGWVCPKCGTDRTRSACPKGYNAALTGSCPMYGVAQSSDNSWVANPDRMGGCFTQDEINEAGAWK